MSHWGTSDTGCRIGGCVILGVAFGVRVIRGVALGVHAIRGVALIVIRYVAVCVIHCIRNVWCTGRLDT